MFWIGLYLDGSMVKWAKVSGEKKKVSIELLRTFPFSEEETFSLPQGSLEESAYKIISGLDSSEVLLRSTQLKFNDHKKILKSLPFQIEPQLPCPAEEAVVSIQVASGDTPKSSKISFYAAKKSVLHHHIQHLQQKDVDPDEVSCTPAALWRFTEHFFKDLSDTLVLHVGAKTSTLVGITDKKPSFSHSFSLGSDAFAAALDHDVKDLNLLNICSEKHPVLCALSEQAKKELSRVFAVFLKKQKEPWEHIVLTGNFSAFPSLKSFIADNLPDSMQLHECQGGDSYDATTLEAYAIPVGLALDGIKEDGSSTKFRQDVFVAPSQQKERIRLFSSFAFVSAVLLTTTVLITSLYKSHKTKQLIETIQSSFHLQNKKIENLVDLERQISSLESSFRKEKVPFNLTPPLPNVSEILAWLSSHPILSAPEETNTVDMKKVKYNLIKYPKVTATSAPYIAKVELEVEIPSKALAKSFQESLQKDSFVDPKKEISWNVRGNTYLISFFLQPRIEGGGA